MRATVQSSRMEKASIMRTDIIGFLIIIMILYNLKNDNTRPCQRKVMKKRKKTLKIKRTN
jgi:hypothetical protein